MKKHKVFLLSAIVIFSFLFNINTYAFSNNNMDYCIDSEGEKTYISKTYVQNGIISFIENTNEGQLLNPEDMFIDSNDNIFIADTGNNRIVKISKDGNIPKIYKSPKDPFYLPTGVFVCENGDIYVADSGNKRIVIMDGTGNVKKVIKKPDSDLLNDVSDFTPVKVAVGVTEYIYTIVGKDFMAIDYDGNFKGFVGAQRLGFSLSRLLINTFASEEQKSRLPQDIPPAYSNFTINFDGQITACSVSETNQVKVLNYLGGSIYPSGFYGEMIVDTENGEEKYPVFNDICTDENGSVILVEQRGGRVYEYDRDGNSVTVFGGKGTTKGYFQNPVAVCRDSKANLYILDKNMNNIQIFKPTEFLNTIHNANALYFSGDYKASLTEWENVVKINPDYPLAATRIGKIYYKNEQYGLSLKNYRNGGNMQGYSEAFGEQRHIFLRKYMGYCFVGAAILIVAMAFFVRKLKKHVDKKVNEFYYKD